MNVNKLFTLDKKQYFEKFQQFVDNNDTMKNYIHPELKDDNEKMSMIYVAYSISYLILKNVQDYSEENIEEIKKDISKLKENNIRDLISRGFNIDSKNSIDFCNSLQE